MLNADSEATVVIGMANISLAILATDGNLLSLFFHHMSTSNSDEASTLCSSKYASSSDFCTETLQIHQIPMEKTANIYEEIFLS